MKARKEENTKEKKNFVLSKFRVFVINHFGFRLVRVWGWRIERKIIGQVV